MASMVTLEKSRGRELARSSSVTMDKNTANVENDSHVFCGINLFSFDISDLGSQNFSEGLDWGHSRPTGRPSAV